MDIEITSRGLLHVFFRQQRKALGLFTLCMLAGIAIAFMSQVRFESTGSLLVRFGSEAMPGIARGNDKFEELSQNDRREIMQSYAEMLESRDLLRAAVTDIGVEALYPGLTASTQGNESPVEAAVKRLAKDDLDIRAGQQSDLITASMLNGNPDVAAHFLSRLFERFIARQSDVYNNPHTGFLDEQAQRTASLLQNAQRDLAEFKAKQGISSIDEELSQLLREKEDIDTVAFEGIGDAQAKLSELQAKKAQMLATYKAGSPQVKTVQKSIDVAKRQIASAQDDLKGAGGTSPGVTAARIQSLDRRIDRLEGLRSRYNDLERQVKIAEENYRTVRLRGEEARVNDLLNQQGITRIAIVDRPQAAAKPARPRRLLILAISLLAGAVLGLGSAVLSELQDERFSTPGQVSAALRLPVMASFSLPQGEREA